MSLLIRCGKYIHISVMKEWLELTEICIFDTSLCNHKERDLFLEYVSSTTMPGLASGNLALIIVNWLNLRSVTIDKAVIDDHFLKNCKLSTKFNFSTVKFFEVNGLSKENVVNLVDIISSIDYLEELTLTKQTCPMNTIYQQLGNSCPHFSTLNLTHFDSPIDSGISSLLLGCTSIRSLNFSNSKFVSDAVVNKISSSKLNRTLTCINLFGCSAVGDIRSLATDCTNLTSCNFGGCSKKLTESMVINVLSNNPNITVLKVSKLVDSSDTLLHTLTMHSPLLTSLDVSSASNITDCGLRALCTGCPHIKSLNVNDNNNLTVSAFQTIADCLHSLTSIHFRQDFENCSDNNTVFLILCGRFQTLSVVNLTDFELCGKPHTEIEYRAQQAQQIANNTPPINYQDRHKGCDQQYFEITNTCFLSILHAKCMDLQSFTPHYFCTLDTLYIVFNTCKSLSYLNLVQFKDKHKGSNIQDPDLFLLASQCQMLTSLVLYGLEYITDVGVSAVLKSNRKLRQLDVRKCSLLSDQFVKSLQKYAPVL